MSPPTADDQPQSPSTGDHLTAITSTAELCELRDLYRCDWPEHCVCFYTLDNFLRWLQREPRLRNLQVFTLNGDWRSEGLFLIVDRYQLFVGSLRPLGRNDDNASLKRAIALLDWRGGYKVSSFLERHRSAVLDVVRERGLRQEFDSLTLLYYMPAAQAAQLSVDCPPGFVLRPLDVADAELIDAHWPNRHQGSLFLLRRLIAWNSNMGVYEEDSGQLVAWCLRLQGGFLGALQVRDSHRRRGLGSLVARATARRLAVELGHDVTALVNKDNVASRGLFEKAGFEVTDSSYWLRTFPTQEGLEWPDDE